ncbi:MAG: tryptophan--tRNA ligase [Patescibacteria group bacterium]
MPTKQTVFSGIQPSGMLHIGNYLGAIKQWLVLQKNHDCIFCIVDYHAITTPYEPKEMPNRIFDAALDYIAAGLDPKKSIIFVQSHVPEHTELAWLLNTITPFGELSRMTQWKEKSNSTDESAAKFLLKRLSEYLNAEPETIKKIRTWERALSKATNKDKNERPPLIDLSNEIKFYDKSLIRDLELHRLREVNAGLLNYPILMAADILLYKTHLVPVGDDQQQHVELTRIIARKFNHQFGETFIMPKAQLSESKRIMSLADPAKKMSKSLGPKHYLALTDTPDAIRQKIKSAVTDVGANENEMSPGVKNLFLLLHEFGSAADNKKFESAYADKTIRYSELKETLAEAVVKKLQPFQKKRAELAEDPKAIWKTLADGAKKARPIARHTLAEVKRKMGLL